MSKKTLKTLIPLIEVEWLFPLWLLVAIIAAFTAELIVISTGIVRVYELDWIGWSVGLVISSVQAMGAAIGSYNATHNARRKKAFKTVGPKDKKRRVLDENKSEPYFGPIVPYSISVLAGMAAAVIAVALYAKIRADANEMLMVLDVAIAIGSPVGSISAAVLNGLFVSNEAAQMQWQQSQIVPVRAVRPQKEKKSEPVRSKVRFGSVKKEIVRLVRSGEFGSLVDVNAADISEAMGRKRDDAYVRRIVREVQINGTEKTGVQEL